MRRHFGLIGDGDRVERLIRDYRTADLTTAQLAMADYARRLTTESASVSQSDVRKLREIGFSDRQILDVNLIVSYFNFVNRIAFGLGVEFNEREVSGYRY